jgi:hypothetical protein
VHHSTTTTARAGNGTRTRDPNLGKVVLYQLSYSRRRRNRSEQLLRSHRSEPSESMLQPRCWKEIRGNGGEGNRTPDLLNAIQALSQLSYAPGDGRLRCEQGFRPEPPSIAVCISRVNEMGLAKTSAASILQRLLGSSLTSEVCRRSLAIAVADRRDATLHFDVRRRS